MLSFEEVDQMLEYNPVSGVLTWKVRRGGSRIGDAAGTILFDYKRGGLARYISVGILRKRYQAHRLCWLLYYGEWPSGEIDHQNHVGTDNWIENLRDVTRRVNNKNKRLYRNNTSGCHGVYWLKKKSKWQVVTCSAGKRTYLGEFHDLQEAISVRKKHEVDGWFHPNHGSD